MERKLRWDACWNLRDLGGYELASRRRTRWMRIPAAACGALDPRARHDPFTASLNPYASLQFGYLFLLSPRSRSTRTSWFPFTAGRQWALSRCSQECP